MKVSLGTRVSVDNISGKNGYGYATRCMVQSLQRLGYSITENDASADVEIWFDQPQNWNFSPGTYKIGYHPWESTKLQPGWVEIMNQCDEIWTPSPLIADWYRADGITRPIYVYEHGVDHVWEPSERIVSDTLRFLHVGGEATRKGGWDTMRLFRRAFPTQKDVSLTLKIIKSSWLNMSGGLGRTSIINESYTFGQLQELFYSHHAYVYPSWGEGFGLTPLQAMATGMPTITVPAWAPYRRFLDPNLEVSSTLATSSWPEIHPGKMLRPSFDDVVENMRYVYDNYDKVSQFAMEQTENIHREYDWDTLTRDAFEKLENRLKKS